MSADVAAATVAVVITTYNHARFLEAAITSVRSQTLAPDEIIVVDDGSTDHPDEVTARFPDVRLIRQDNAGLAAARNTGWQASSSELVTFLDADDRLLPDALRVNACRLLEHPTAAFSYGAYIDVDAATGRTVEVGFRPADDGFASFLRGNLIGMHATVMYRRTHLADVGGFTPGLPACEDYDLYLRLSERYPFVHGPEPLAEYWHHDGNMSRDLAMMLRAALAVLRGHEPAARRLALAAAYREGRAGWKSHYVTVWSDQVARTLARRRLDASLVRQGASLLRQAPATAISIPCRAAGARAYGRARRMARRIRWKR